MSSLTTAPVNNALSAPELTTTVVIGSGLSGLAVASELSRQGIASIVVESHDCTDTGSCRTLLGDSVALSERNELMRLLRGYASSHHLDVRRATYAEDLSIIGHPVLVPAPVPTSKKWAVQTATGVLLADHVVLTKYPQSQLRKLLHSLGISIGRDLKGALESVGLHLVGISDRVAPSTRDIVRQARLVSDHIAASRPLAYA